jgi:hypothetical protein
VVRQRAAQAAHKRVLHPVVGEALGGHFDQLPIHELDMLTLVEDLGLDHAAHVVRRKGALRDPVRAWRHMDRHSSVPKRSSKTRPDYTATAERARVAGPG